MQFGMGRPIENRRCRQQAHRNGHSNANSKPAREPTVTLTLGPPTNYKVSHSNKEGAHDRSPQKEPTTVAHSRSNEGAQVIYGRNPFAGLDLTAWHQVVCLISQQYARNGMCEVWRLGLGTGNRLEQQNAKHPAEKCQFSQIRIDMTKQTSYYISITGLKIGSLWQYPAFIYHAKGSSQQAQNAQGNISVTTRFSNGIHHTLSVWTDSQSMHRFMVSGAHARAMQAGPEIAALDGIRVCGFESDTVPSWNEALEIWREKAKPHGSSKQRAKASVEEGNRAQSLWLAVGIAVFALVSLSLFSVP